MLSVACTRLLKQTAMQILIPRTQNACVLCLKYLVTADSRRFCFLIHINIVVKKVSKFVDLDVVRKFAAILVDLQTHHDPSLKPFADKVFLLCCM
jgi:hypothetical protein